MNKNISKCKFRRNRKEEKRIREYLETYNYNILELPDINRTLGLGEESSVIIEDNKGLLDLGTADFTVDTPVKFFQNDLNINLGKGTFYIYLYYGDEKVLNSMLSNNFKVEISYNNVMRTNDVLPVVVDSSGTDFIFKNIVITLIGEGTASTFEETVYYMITKKPLTSIIFNPPNLTIPDFEVQTAYNEVTLPWQGYSVVKGSENTDGVVLGGVITNNTKGKIKIKLFTFRSTIFNATDYNQYYQIEIPETFNSVAGVNINDDTFIDALSLGKMYGNLSSLEDINDWIMGDPFFIRDITIESSQSNECLASIEFNNKACTLLTYPINSIGFKYDLSDMNIHELDVTRYGFLNGVITHRYRSPVETCIALVIVEVYPNET